MFEKKPLAIYAALQESPINIRKSFDQEGISLTNNKKKMVIKSACIQFIFKKSKLNQQTTS